MPTRSIRLRRPPVLQLQEGPFVPEASEETRDQIERRWSALCRDNSAYFDGRALHVLGIHRNGHGGASIHVMECAYRFYACQVGWVDLGVRLLGVKSLTSREGRVLVGRRSRSVGQYAGLWEFAPSGGVPSGKSPVEAIRDELREETGLEAASEPVAIAILFDETIDTWEIVYRIDPSLGMPATSSGEYDILEWRDPGDLPAGLSPIARQMANLL